MWGFNRTKNYRLRCSFCESLEHTKERCWKKKNPYKISAIITNYLKVMIDDELVVQNHLDRICGSNHDLFSHTKVHRQRVHVDDVVREHGGVNVPKGDSS